MSVCYVRGVYYLVNRERPVSVAYVIVNSIVEHLRLLLNVSDIFSVVFHVYLSDINTADGYLTLVVIVITEQQIYQGRFSRTRSSYYTDNVAGLNAEINILENLFGTVKGEVYVLELNNSAHVRIGIALSEVMLGLCVENIHYSFKRRSCILHGV